MSRSSFPDDDNVVLVVFRMHEVYLRDGVVFAVRNLRTSEWHTPDTKMTILGHYYSEEQLDRLRLLDTQFAKL